MNNRTELCDSLSQFYQHLLMMTDDGKKLLEWRSITPRAAEKFRIGYSPQEDNGVVRHMGNVLDTLTHEKLFYCRNGEIHDTMRGRLIFPLQNENGHFVGFGGRDITDQDNVKYLNTGDTDEFTKSNILFGLPQAKKDIQEKNYVVLMEGYMDVIRAYQNDVKNCISALGTNVSLEQANIIRRHTANVVLAFDNDNAGSQAMLETAKLLQSVGCKVLIADMGEKNPNYDPDDYIQKYGSIAFQKNVVAKAMPIVHFFMKNRAQSYNFDYADDRFDFFIEVLSFLKSSDDKKQYADTLSILQKKFNLPLSALQNN